MTDYDDRWLVRDAMADAYRRLGLPPDGGHGAATVSYPVGRFRLTVPNLPARRRALPLHDALHLVTGYGTTWRGEAEMGAWELGSGCGSYVAPWVLATIACALGLVLCPGRVWRAFGRGRASHTLYRVPWAATCYDMTLGEVRSRLHVPTHAVAPRVSDILTFGLFTASVMLVIAAPVLLACRWAMGQ